MNIQTLQPKDATLILPHLLHVQDIHATAQPERYVKDPAPETVLNWLTSKLEQDEVTALIAIKNGNVMGYLLYIISTDQETPFTRIHTRAILDQICVLPEFQGNGVATQLINDMHARATAQGITASKTTYGTFNAASDGLMQSTGFTPTTIVAVRYT